MTAKTVPPSPRRLREARAIGDLPRAPILVAAVGSVGFTAIVFIAISMTSKQAVASLLGNGIVDLYAWGRMIACIVAIAILPIFLAPFITAPFTGGFARRGQRRGVATPASNAAIVAPLVAAFAIGVAGALGVAGIASHANVVASAVVDGARRPFGALAMLVCTLLVLMVIAGIVDAVLARHRWRARWSMTHAEARREYREEHVDPAIAAACARTTESFSPLEAAEAVAKKALIVVVGEGVAVAVGTSESPEQNDAPIVLAAAHGQHATRLTESTPPDRIVEDTALALRLAALHVGAAIPPDHYESVARALTFRA